MSGIDSNPYGRPIVNTLANMEEILKKKTIIDPDKGCWLWQGKHKRGYGFIYFEGKSTRISRIVGMMYLGLRADQTDIFVLHRCPNKNCWNPAHLYLGDAKDNWKDLKESVSPANLKEILRRYGPVNRRRD